MKNAFLITLILLILCQSIYTYTQSYDFSNFDPSYGINQKTSESSQNWYENTDYYQFDNCWNKAESSTLESNWNSGFDLYEYDSYGIKQISKSYESNWIDGFNIYEYDNYGMKNRIGTIENNHIGGYDIYQYDDFGIMIKKAGTIDKKYNY